MNIIPFFLTYIIVLYLFLSAVKGEEKNRKIFAYLFFLICVILAGLRNVAVGSDTYAYYLQFEEVKRMTWLQVWTSFSDYISGGSGKDLGYLLLQKLFQVVFNNFQLFMIFVVLVFYIPVVKMIYWHTKTLQGLFLACMLLAALFYQFTYTGLRQVLVFGIVAFALRYIEERKFVKYAILILIAATIHKTALILLPCYFFVYLKKTIFVYIASLAALPILFAYRDLIALFMATTSGEERYMMYVDGTFTTAGTPVFTILILLIVVAGVIYQKQIAEKNSDSYIISNFVIVGLIFTPLTWVDPNLMRLVMYFTLFLPIYFARLVDAMPKNIRSIACVVAVAGMAFLMLKQAVPYAFFWQDMALGDNY